MVGCNNENKQNVKKAIPVVIELERFDQKYFEATAATFPNLKAKYPYLFPGEATDSLWLSKKNDSLSQVLYREVQDIFGDFKEEHNEIENLFGQVKSYYPNFKEPKLITLISNLDLENQVIYADSLLIVSLDTYLGKDKKYYTNYPDYLRKNFDKEHVIKDVAMAVAYETTVHIPYRIFLERIIAAGKLKYAMKQFLPTKSVGTILDYSQEDMDWVETNEESVWKYFIEKEYFYSSDKDLQRRFLDPAPFSKFYRTTDAASPGQIGIWLGYQIVKAYMENNVVSLPELMATPPKEIFNKSKYKPRH